MNVIYQILDAILPFSWLDYHFMKNAFASMQIQQVLLQHAKQQEFRV